MVAKRFYPIKPRNKQAAIDRLKNSIGQDFFERAQEKRGPQRPALGQPGTNSTKPTFSPVERAEPRYRGPQAPVGPTRQRTVTPSQTRRNNPTPQNQKRGRFPLNRGLADKVTSPSGPALSKSTGLNDVDAAYHMALVRRLKNLRKG